MADHSARRRRREVVVHDPAVPRAVLARWWVLQRLVFLLPVVALGLALLGRWQMVGAGLVLAGTVVAVAVSPGSGVRIGPYAGIVLRRGQAITDWYRADEASRVIERSWAELGALADPRDIGPVLARARFQLAGLLVARVRLDKAVDALGGARVGLTPASALRTRLAEQRAELMERHRSLTAEITGRIAALERLATSSGEHAWHERAARRARRVLRQTRGIALTPPPGDPVAEVGERTAAVLGAYRDLVAEFGDLRDAV